MRREFLFAIVALSFMLIALGCQNPVTAALQDGDMAAATREVEEKCITLPVVAPPDVPPAITVNLVTDRDLTVGSVDVLVENDEVYVTFEAQTGWVLSHTYLSVKSDPKSFPHARKGEPIPARFEFRANHGRGVAAFTYDVGRFDPGTVIYIAAHADLASTGKGRWYRPRRESAWAGDLEFPGRSKAAYFSFTLPTQNLDPFAGLLEAFKAAWEGNNLNAVMALYDPQFTYPGTTLDQLRTIFESSLGLGGDHSWTLANEVLESEVLPSGTEAIASFHQVINRDDGLVLDQNVLDFYMRSTDGIWRFWGYPYGDPIHALLGALEAAWEADDLQAVMNLYASSFLYGGVDKAGLQDYYQQVLQLGKGYSWEVSISESLTSIGGNQGNSTFTMTINSPDNPSLFVVMSESQFSFTIEDLTWKLQGYPNGGGGALPTPQPVGFSIQSSNRVAIHQYTVQIDPDGLRWYGYDGAQLTPPFNIPVPVYTVIQMANQPSLMVGLPVAVGASWTDTVGPLPYGGWIGVATVASTSETVASSAGSFLNCLKIVTTITGSGSEYGAPATEDQNLWMRGQRTIWFAKGVGIVRIEWAHADGTVDTADLIGYSTASSTSYFPLASGNGWMYEWTNSVFSGVITETFYVE